MYWAWQQGKDGKDFRETKNAAAEAGTLAHEAVEAWVHGLPYQFPDTDVGKKAETAFGAFLKWAKQTNLKITQPEMALVSEKWQFGGCLDGILLGTDYAIADWKSSNGIYPDYLVQVAAYGLLWKENFPDKALTGGYNLIRFDKEYGDFHAHAWSELATAEKAFLLMRKLYDYDKELKQRAK